MRPRSPRPNRLLPAQVEIAIAAGDVAKARRAVDELAAIVPRTPRRPWPPARGSPRVECCWPRAIRRALPASSVARSPPGSTSAHRTRSPDHAAPLRALRALEDEEDADLEPTPPSTSSADSGRSSTRLPPNATWPRSPNDATARDGSPDLHVHGHRRLDAFAESLGDDAWEHLLRWHDDTLRG